jgi:hypothetical protein
MFGIYFRFFLNISQYLGYLLSAFVRISRRVRGRLRYGVVEDRGKYIHVREIVLKDEVSMSTMREQEEK